MSVGCHCLGNEVPTLRAPAYVYSTSVCVCVCVYICIYTHTAVCVHTCISVYIYIISYVYSFSYTHTESKPRHGTGLVPRYSESLVLLLILFGVWVISHCWIWQAHAREVQDAEAYMVAQLQDVLVRCSLSQSFPSLIGQTQHGHRRPWVHEYGAALF